MVRKIILGLFLLCLFIAIPLAAIGIRHVEIGPAFIGFMNQTSKDLEVWKIAIPDIPEIPKPLEVVTINNPLDFLVSFGNAVITFVNFLSRIINVIISMLNMVIQFTQYVFTLVKNLIAFSDTLKRIGTPA